MKFGKAVVKLRVPMLILAILLLIPSVIGMAKTRINYDMLTYLPSDIDTVKGQDLLMEDFGKGAFSLVMVENMEPKDVSKLADQIRGVDHVATVLWYDSVMDVNIPIEMLPDNVYEAFNKDNATMLAIFFDSATSDDVTMDAIRDIRRICNKDCYISGMSALVTDLKDLCEKEEPIYVGLAVVCALAAMMILLDGWLVPFVFLASIGMAILYNMGTNYFFGEISYITKAISAVLQLAVTMDYSIFLWNSYNEKRETIADKNEAMATAIRDTLTSVIGSSITTVAGFIALCFMSFTMGRDLGIVMAKGVLLGVIGCVTTLPALILALDKPLQKTRHRSIIPKPEGFSEKLLKVFPVMLIIFAILIVPGYYGYSKTNSEVYYDMGKCLPSDMDFVTAQKRLEEKFGVASTHMVLV
ncbi:MAG: MMPL family transporter, partial [Lachnospiraceae bacterium]|nr:MMPL family transporter [Lachnospiraceae bacterium]